MEDLRDDCGRVFESVACAPASVTGALNNRMSQNDVPDSAGGLLAKIVELGGLLHESHYPVSWAWAGSSPLQWMERVPSHFVRDGVRATILKEEQGGSILFAASGPNDGKCGDSLVFLRNVPAIREVPVRRTYPSNAPFSTTTSVDQSTLAHGIPSFIHRVVRLPAFADPLLFRSRIRRRTGIRCRIRRSSR